MQSGPLHTTAAVLSKEAAALLQTQCQPMGPRHRSRQGARKTEIVVDVNVAAVIIATLVAAAIAAFHVELGAGVFAVFQVVVTW